MTTTPELPRTERLRKWMVEHGITDAVLGEKLSISAQATNKFVNAEIMPVKYHETCVALGFPLELLPMPFDKPRGRRARNPYFPGLEASHAEI